MKQLGHAPNGWRTMVGFLAVAAACQRADDAQVGDSVAGGDTTTAAAFQECNPPARVSQESRADLVAWANRLSYQAADSSRGYVSAFRRTATDSMTVQVAGNSRRPRAVLRRGCLIGQITSARADTSLGLAPGRNYVWADSNAGSWRVLVFPEGAERVRTHSLVIHNHRTSRLAVDSVRKPCMECEEYGWCRWPMDTIRTARVIPGAPDLTTRPDSPRVRRQ